MDVLGYLKKLESHGFEAYIVGGYVRDKILDIDSLDIDIITNAHPDDVAKIFKVDKTDKVGCISFENGMYHIDITTFRKESKYHRHIPSKVSYVNDLMSDLKRRDFTINSICLNSSNEYVDMLGGMEDLKKGIIRVIGKPKDKFREDPLRILRAFRFASIYNFEIDARALEYIINHKNLLREISKIRVKEEITRMFESENVIKTFEFLNNLNMLKKLNIECDSIKYIDDTLGMWSQMNYRDFPFKKSEINIMDEVNEIIDNKKITPLDVYTYNEKSINIASKLLDVDITDIIKNMNIKNGEHLKIDGNDISNILNTKDGKLIKKIKNDLINNLVSGKLSNDKESLKKYIVEKWK